MGWKFCVVGDEGMITCKTSSSVATFEELWRYVDVDKVSPNGIIYEEL